MVGLKVDEYFKNLYDSQLTYFNTKCSKCNKIQSDNKTKIFQFCYKCQQDYCFDCVNNKNKHSLNHLENVFQLMRKKQDVLNISKKENLLNFVKMIKQIFAIF